MNNARNAYEALLDLGISEDRAREMIRDETGKDPIGLANVVAYVDLRVRVELEGDELEGLSEDDEDELVRLAHNKAADAISNYGVDFEHVMNVDIDSIEEDE